jgi:hypothetical protein
MHAPVLSDGLDARVAHVPIHVTRCLARSRQHRTPRRRTRTTPRACASSDAILQQGEAAPRAEDRPAAPNPRHWSSGWQAAVGPAQPANQPTEGMAPSASLSRVQTFMLTTTATISSIAASSTGPYREAPHAQVMRWLLGSSAS